MTAIQNRLVVTFTYDGLHRVVEPYTLGLSTAGRLALRAFQTEGNSKSGRTYDWHLFSVENIRDITMTESRFLPTRPGYNPADKGMRTIFCHA
ncbi:MAG: WYL domain-containing protein [Oxalobacter formigenes]|nr:WYL domain-containing protein [Oxalobacter formigenes]